MAELVRDRYEPLGVVGRGGQGEVLQARDRLHDRTVALKVRHIGSDAERSLLLSEARILLGVRPHPNLALAREDFVDGDRYYLVMDWIEGRDLRCSMAAAKASGWRTASPAGCWTPSPTSPATCRCWSSPSPCCGTARSTGC